MKIRLLFIYFISFGSMAQNFDIQGHRGCRGLMPENSLPAFEKALEIGVTTLELDVVISKDNKVVVSHDPYFNPDICLTPDGKAINTEQKNAYFLYLMDYEEIRKYDCGSLGNKNYPEQQKIAVFKPLLSETIEHSDNYCAEIQRKYPSYNIELKSSKEGYGVTQPNPKEFCELVYNVIKDIPVTRLTIQSFDHQILQYWKISYPQYTLALLEENISSPVKAIENLGFDPDIYSPEFILINKKKIQALYDREIKVIPWTVNEKEDMIRLMEWGVEGIITDYPDRFKELFPDKMSQ